MQQDNPWKKLSTKVVYENQWITVHEDQAIRPEGTESIYSFVETTDSVMAVTLNDAQEIYLVWTYRYPVKSWGWELPGGAIEAGEDPQLACVRELAEEEDVIASNWKQIGATKIYNGICTGTMYTFLASQLMSIPRDRADDSETTNTGRFFSLTQVVNMIKSGEIDDSQTIAGIFLAQQNLHFV